MKRMLYVNQAVLLLLASLSVQASEKQPLPQPEQYKLMDIQESLTRKQKLSPMDVDFPVTTIDDLPDFVILNEIMPNLDNKSLSCWAKISKKYATLFKKDLEIRQAARQFFSEISNEYLEELYKASEQGVVELIAFALSPERLKQHAVIERELRIRQYFSKLSNKDLEEIRKFFGTALGLKAFALSPDQLSQRATIELEKPMRKQQTKFISNSIGEMLILTESNLDKLYPRVFDDPRLIGLKSLILNHNNINELSFDILKNLKNLDFINLNGNNLLQLPVDTFKDLNNLKELHLFHNQFNQLPVDLFKGLNNLEKLDLSHNKIGQLPAKLFKDLKNLTGLNLSYNKLAELPASIFKNLNNLYFLDLNNNEFVKLPADLFKNLNELLSLDLSGNKLSSRNKNEIREVLPRNCQITF